MVDDEDDWANNFRAHHLGEKLISLALQSAVFDGKPIFELKEDQEGSGKGLKTMQRIGVTEAAETWIGEQTPEALDLFNPIYVPMIVEPRPWTSLSEGGYLATPMKLFKRQTGKRAQQRLAKADLSAVYAAVNALQNTPYRINQAIYRFQREAWTAELPFFGLTNEDQLKGLQKMMAFRFGQSVRLSAEERFYFPWQVDHRGRVYPVPQLMNPQSDHIGRALIEFADGKPLGERGAYWLAIHLANCYWKKKKVSFKNRLAWVQENEEEILDFAANPLTSAHSSFLDGGRPTVAVPGSLSRVETLQRRGTRHDLAFADQYGRLMQRLSASQRDGLGSDRRTRDESDAIPRSANPTGRSLK